MNIIIGAGMSGLAAGIRLAYYEKPVCILERHWTIGGLNSFYRLRKRDHDVGLHAVTNYCGPGDKHRPLLQVLRQLKLDRDAFLLAPQKQSRIVFPGCALRFTNEIDVLREEIRRQFPKEIDGFDELCDEVRDMKRGFGKSPESGSQIIARHVRHSQLRNMLLFAPVCYGSAGGNDLDGSLFGTLFSAIFLEGFGRPPRGVRHILKTLVKHYRALGGKLRLHTGVKRICIENGQAVGVELDSGEMIATRRIASSAGGPETAALCGDAWSSPPPRGTTSCFETIYDMDCPPAQLGFDDAAVFFSNGEPFDFEEPREPVSLTAGVICSPQNYEYDKPIDGGRIRITSLANTTSWHGFSPEDYAAAKETWAPRLLAAARNAVPEFSAHVLDKDSFTPRTISRFTGHFGGAMYGSNWKSPEGVTPVENLFLIGNDAGLPGITGAMMTGITVTNRHLLD